MSGWLSAGAAAFSVAGTAIKAGGQIKGGQSNSQANYYQAAVARRNAQAYRDAGTREVQGGQVAADVAGLKNRENVGRALAQQGANHVDVGGKTATDVRQGIATAGRLDQLTVLSNAQLKNWGYRMKADQEEAQANLYQAGGNNAGPAGISAGLGTIFQSASSLPTKWLSGSAPQVPQGGQSIGGGAAVGPGQEAFPELPPIY
jgi:hypothetical protein